MIAMAMNVYFCSQGAVNFAVNRRAGQKPAEQGTWYHDGSWIFVVYVETTAEIAAKGFANWVLLCTF